MYKFLAINNVGNILISIDYFIIIILFINGGKPFRIQKKRLVVGMYFYKDVLYQD